MGKAVSYALGQWESLEIYLQDAQIEIDNNLVWTKPLRGMQRIALSRAAGISIEPESVAT
jgi:Transposase IS66 family